MSTFFGFVLLIGLGQNAPLLALVVAFVSAVWLQLRRRRRQANKAARRAARTAARRQRRLRATAATHAYNAKRAQKLQAKLAFPPAARRP